MDATAPLSPLTLLLPDPEATRALGRCFGEVAAPGDIYYLLGPLGAGKTSFVQGLATALGITDAVVSPTFTVINEYGGGGLPLFHWDLYRLPVPTDVAELGWDDFRGRDGVLAVEWADHLGGTFPDPGLTLVFAYGPGDGREVVIVFPERSWMERFRAALAPFLLWERDPAC